MGLFDKLVSGVKEVVDSVAESVQGPSTTPPPPVPASSQGWATPVAPQFTTANAKPYFAGILAQEFAEYEIRESVPVAELGGVGKPYEFGLYQFGALKAVVVLVERNRDHNRAYLGSKEAALAARVPFVNFYLHMPNERGFVISRIRRLMAA